VDANRSRRNAEHGGIRRRVIETALSALRVVRNPRVASAACVQSIGWVLPVDSRLFRIYLSRRTELGSDRSRTRSTFASRFWWDMTLEARCARPDDDGVQAHQGAIPLHSDAYLAGSGRGIAMLRPLSRGEEHAVTEGHDAVGVRINPVSLPIVFATPNGPRHE
jgi:hypothetical protein